MAKTEKNKINTKENMFLILNLVIAVVTMALVGVLVGVTWQKDLIQISLFLGIIIFLQVIFQGLLFFAKEKKKDKVRALTIGIVFALAMVLAYLIPVNSILLFVSVGIIFLAYSMNQFMLVSKEETKKGKITNILLGIFLLFLAIITIVDIIDNDEEELYIIPLLAALIFLFTSFKKVLFPTLKLEKMKIFIDILVKTHTIDIIVCLLTFMIAFSFALPIFEEKITNFWDAMWYCFTVITTIGFGDLVVTSRIGRILTVILGIYGIVVVAILTSVIVNFYNEVSAKEKARDIIE